MILLYYFQVISATRTCVCTYTYLGSRLIPGTNKRAYTSLRTYVAHNTYPTLARTYVHIRILVAG